MFYDVGVEESRMKVTVAVLVLGCLQVVGGVGIPEVYTTGTNYQVGKDMGSTFRAVIQDYFRQSDSLNKVLQFVHTTEGQQYYNGYLGVVKTVFPQYLEELTGLAEGAGVNFTQAFGMMIGSEIRAILKLKGEESCSDVYLNDNQVAIGHNEDADPLIKDRAFLVRAVVVNDAGDVVENYTSYTYPGCLSGNAFSFNGDGKVFTVNALYPALVETNKIPRYFMNRALLGIKSQGDLEKLLSGLGVGVAYGFNVNYADTRNDSDLLTSYEVSPMSGVKQSLVTKRTVGLKGSSEGDTQGHYYHFNMYDHTNLTQIPKDIVSSKHRKARADALPVPANVEGMTVILGDQGDSQYPIYRTPRPSDEEATVATGIFIISSCALMIFKTNPKTTNRPIMTLNLPPGVMCMEDKHYHEISKMLK